MEDDSEKGEPRILRKDGEEIEIVYADVGDEIEIGEDEEVEFIELPPPPFGAFPPEFAPSRPQEIRPRPKPQTGRGRNLNIKKTSKKSAETAPAESDSTGGKPFRANIRPDEAQPARHSGRLAAFFKFFLAAAVCLAGIAACGYAIFIFHEKLASSSVAESAEASANSGGIADKRANAVVRSFYEFSGGLATSAEFRDMLVKGVVKSGGAEKSFYGIRRPNGRTYAKLGDTRAYFAERLGAGVFLLRDMRVSGAREKLSGRDALFVRTMTLFDEPLFSAFFPQSENADDSSAVSYAGAEIFDGRDAEVVAVENGAVKTRYFFAAASGEMLAAEYSDGSQKALVKFSDYRAENGVKFPLKKEVFAGGKKIFEMSLDLAIRNRGFLFP